MWHPKKTPWCMVYHQFFWLINWLIFQIKKKVEDQYAVLKVRQMLPLLYVKKIGKFKLIIPCCCQELAQVWVHSRPYDRVQTPAEAISPCYIKIFFLDLTRNLQIVTPYFFFFFLYITGPSKDNICLCYFYVFPLALSRS